MATVQNVQSPEVDELTREHRADWHAFTRFTTYGAIAVAALLSLMAIFLL